MSAWYREQQQRNEKQTSVPLQKDRKSPSKTEVIPASFLKIEVKGTFFGAKEGQIVELIGD